MAARRHFHTWRKRVGRSSWTGFSLHTIGRSWIVKDVDGESSRRKDVDGRHWVGLVRFVKICRAEDDGLGDRELEKGTRWASVLKFPSTALNFNHLKLTIHSFFAPLLARYNITARIMSASTFSSYISIVTVQDDARAQKSIQKRRNLLVVLNMNTLVV